MKTNLSILTGTSLFLAACAEHPSETGTQEPTATSGAPPTVLTTTYPVAYLTERIVSGQAEVECPVPPGEDPIFWMPDDATLLRFQEADAIVLNGASFAKWVEKVSLPQQTVINSSASLSEELIRYESAVTHSHGKAGEHSHEGIDGHTWVDPETASEQADAILSGLQRLFPEEAASLVENHSVLSDDLSTLRDDVSALGLGDGTPLLASHPAYNYIARSHSWNIANLDLDPGSPLTPAQLEAIQIVQSRHPARVMLWESEPIPEISEILKARFAIDSIVFSPCETQPAAGDFLSVMRENVVRLREALRKEP